MAFSLDKSRRIRRHSEYERVYSGGVRYPGRYLVGLTRRADGPLRVGITVSRKVGGACVRNLVKRRIREAVRVELDPGLSGWELVLVAKREAGKAAFSEIAKDVREINRTFLSRERKVPKESGAEKKVTRPL